MDIADISPPASESPGEGATVHPAEAGGETVSIPGQDRSHDGTNGGEPKAMSPEVLRSTQHLAEEVSAFLLTLEPLKPFVPPPMREKMQELEDMALKCQSMKLPNPTNLNWSCDVLKLSFETWKLRGPSPPQNFSGPRPGIVAYYQALGPNLNPVFQPDSNDIEFLLPPEIHPESSLSERNLRRVVIVSEILNKELLHLSPKISAFPLVMAPPYKLLMEYLPQLKARLGQVETELGRLQVEGTSTAAEGEATSTDQTPGDGSGSVLNSQRQGHMKERIAHLRCLTEFVDEELGDLVQLKQQIANCSLDQIAFEDLWHLFKPGDLVYSTEQGKERLCRLYFITGGHTRKTKRIDDLAHFPSVGFISETCSPLKLFVYTVGFNGKMAGPIQDSIRIPHYPGKKKITELPAFPLQFHPDQDILGYFENRGREFMSSTGHRYYEGLARVVSQTPRSPDSDSSDDSDHETRHVSTRYEDIVSDVYVDFEEYFGMFPTSKPKTQVLTTPAHASTEVSESFASNTPGMSPYPPKGSTSTRTKPVPPPPPPPRGRNNLVPPNRITQLYAGHEVDTTRAEDFFAHNREALEPFKPAEDLDRLTPEFYQLLPHEVPGYAFRYRKWYLLDIDLLQHINPDRYSGFDDLVIPADYKHLLTALVNNHTSGAHKRKEKLRKQVKGLKGTEIDVVPGKGEGLIILLHGPPGSGKTSTAETISAFTRRPLYSITCGDIGLDPEDAETKLDEHTVRADKWGCVLLLDEADVFLMQRTWKEIERNVLVSIFLRQLEYYSGILFLTTNRPGTIDEAFKSRIHVSLRYPSINLLTTMQMWKNILARLETDNASAEIKVVFDADKLLAFAEKHFKSREQTDSMWNGRQIRNAFQTAIALGHAERITALSEAKMSAEDAETHRNQKKWMTVKLTVKNFRRISETTNEFEDYMVSLRGRDADNARETEVRDDNYDPHPDMSTPGRKNYGQGSSMSMNGRGGSGWGPWGEAATTGGRGGRREVISFDPSSSGTMNSRNVGKGKGSVAGRQTAVVHGMDSEEHDEDDDDDDDEDDMDSDN